MCAADTTVEWPGSEEEEKKKEKLAIGPTSGNGVEYKCRDWEAVYRFAVGHRATDRKEYWMHKHYMVLNTITYLSVVYASFVFRRRGAVS
jgi:hypothetical protein